MVCEGRPVLVCGVEGNFLGLTICQNAFAAESSFRPHWVLYNALQGTLLLDFGRKNTHGLNRPTSWVGLGRDFKNFFGGLVWVVGQTHF